MNILPSNAACQVDLCICLPSLSDLALQRDFSNKKLSVENSRGNYFPLMSSAWCTVTEGSLGKLVLDLQFFPGVNLNNALLYSYGVFS